MLRMARPTRRNSSSFHQFRKRVPADLRGRVTGTKLVVEFPASGADPAVVVNATVGLNEVTFSLRTRDPAVAKARQGIATAAAEDIFANLRRARPVDLTTPQAVALGGHVYRDLTSSWRDRPDLVILGGDGGPDDNSVTLHDLARDEDYVSGVTADVLAHHRLPSVAHESVERVKDHIAIAISTAADRLVANARGDYGPDPYVSRFPAFVPPQTPPVPPQPPAATKRTSAAKSAPSQPLKRVLIPGNPRQPKHPAPPCWSTGSPSWADLSEAWSSGHTSARKSATTRDQWLAFFRRFATWFDRPPNELTRSDVRSWVEKRRASGTSPNTLKNSDVAYLRRLFIGIRGELLPDNFVNPTSNIEIQQISRASRDSIRLRGYEDHEAAAVLAAAERDDRPLFRFAPLLLAMTGARAAEITQLRACDVLEKSGHLCVDITPDAGRLKNAASIRVVPLHAGVIASGFLDYVATKHGTDRLFIRSHAAECSERTAKTTVHQLARWIRTNAGFPVGRKVGVDPCHGFRHAFNTRAREAGIDSEVIHAICGHEQATVGATYGHFSVAVKAAAIARLTVPKLATVSRQTFLAGEADHTPS